ncbi:MAG: hypothetical protein IPF41_07685 [Flavobacteriales bacterium]|nr:hypothetical protein [Flavobacteriales bacterium]
MEVVMKLREKMMNPEIGFDVRLQQVDENLKAQVASVLSTDQEMGRQVFALIVLNRFLEPPIYAGRGGAGTGDAAAAGTAPPCERASQQPGEQLAERPQQRFRPWLQLPAR